MSGIEVIGVVLHERGAAGEAVGHDFHDAGERGGFPIAFTGEAVAVFHQALHGEAGQLLHAMQVFEGGGEGSEIAFLQQRSEADLDGGGITQRLVASSAFY